MKRLALVVYLFLLGGCSSDPQMAPSVPASSPAPVPVAISLKQVADAFDAAGLPIGETVVYDERSDPNGLLGRPGRYVEKMNFTDKRIKPPSFVPSNKADREAALLNCSIEIFKNLDDAQNRHDYLANLGRASGIFDTYRYLHKNVLVRIDLKLIPSEAEEYRRALETIP
jgi:hypothetical protein